MGVGAARVGETRPGSLPVAGMVAAGRRAVVGRTREAEVVAAALGAGRSVLLEGPPGTGKTTLLRALASGAGIGLVVVEGSAELTPSRIVGTHDPSQVMASGYRDDGFVPGPLVDAMLEGSLLYVEELNRVPEETVNVLLGVLSERRMHVPRYREVSAAGTFRLVAAMNPFDAVGTGRVSPALYDRTCRVAVGYQDEPHEVEVVGRAAAELAAASQVPVVQVPAELVLAAVAATRATRCHPDLRIGSSVRGAIDLVAVALTLSDLRGTAAGGWREAGLDAALAALSGRVTAREGSGRSAEEVIAEIWAQAAGEGSPPGKHDAPAGTSHRSAPGPSRS